jgi:Fe2+ transport system protein FeoA
MPLIFAGKGKFQVNSIKGGHAIKNRLAKMGIIEGVVLRVPSDKMGGPVVVELTDSQYGLGIGVASKIDVTPV